MGRLAVIGEEARISGWSLAGADIHPAESPAEVEAAWTGLQADVVVVIVTPECAAVVRSLRSTTGSDRLVAVMPG